MMITKNLKFTLLFSAILMLAQFAAAQTFVKALIEDENGAVSVATYNYATGVLTIPFNLDNTEVGDGFYSETATFDRLNNRIITATDTGICVIATQTGTVTRNPFPFSASNGFDLTMHHDPISDKVYCLIEDANSDIRVATYDYGTNSLSNDINLANTALQNGFYSESATFDSQTNQILVATDGGISAVNVTTGAVSQQPFPFSTANGFDLSMHYDADSNRIHCLIEDGNGDLMFADYDFASNTLSNTVNLNSTALSAGFYSFSATYHAPGQVIVVSGDNGMHTVNVVNGIVTGMPFPFPGSNGYNLGLYGGYTVVAGVAEDQLPAYTAYPNPATEVLKVEASTFMVGEMQLRTVDGRVVKQLALSGKTGEMQVADVISGTYLLHIETKAGSSTTKIVIQ